MKKTLSLGLLLIASSILNGMESVHKEWLSVEHMMKDIELLHSFYNSLNIAATYNKRTGAVKLWNTKTNKLIRYAGQLSAQNIDTIILEEDQILFNNSDDLGIRYLRLQIDDQFFYIDSAHTVAQNPSNYYKPQTRKPRKIVSLGRENHTSSSSSSNDESTSPASTTSSKIFSNSNSEPLQILSSFEWSKKENSYIYKTEEKNPHVAKNVNTLPQLKLTEESSSDKDNERNLDKDTNELACTLQ